MQISGDSLIVIEHPLFQTESGGANPTSPLQLFLQEISFAKAMKVYRQFHYLKEQKCLTTVNFGVYFETNLLGAISFGTPNAKNLFPFYTEQTQQGWVEIKRLALSPLCPKNSESRVIAISCRLIRKKFNIRGICTYADTSQNHQGTIYKASGFEYVGLTDVKSDYLLENGKLLQRGKPTEYIGEWIPRSRKHLFIKQFS